MSLTVEKEDHVRDAAFNRFLYGQSAARNGGIMSMFGKDNAAQKLPLDEYFKHWDDKDVKREQRKYELLDVQSTQL